MKTRAQYDFYLNLISIRESDFVSENVKVIPKVFYDVYPSGLIQEHIITGVYYNNKQHFSFDERAKRKSAERVRLYYEINPPLDVNNILFLWETRRDGWKSSSAIKANELSKKFPTKELAEVVAGEIIAKNEAEKVLLLNGHTRCQRCQKVVPDTEIINRKMCSIANFGHGGKMMKFCSGECAANEQYSLEG